MEKKRDWLRARFYFMTHDPRYIEVWNKVKLLREKVPGYPNYNYWQTSEGKKDLEYGLLFDLKYGMLNPEKSYDDLINEHDLLFKDLVEKNLRSFAITQDRDGATLFDNLNNGVINITINFNKINSIFDIKNEVKSIIDRSWKHYLKCNNNKHSTFKMRDFQRIQKVGELRKQNLKFKEIAEKVFDDHLDGEKRARQDFAVYEGLIAGGWRNLVTP